MWFYLWFAMFEFQRLETGPWTREHMLHNDTHHCFKWRLSMSNKVKVRVSLDFRLSWIYD